jgi:hypothetical protein
MTTTIRQATGSVLGMITETAEALSSTVNTITSGAHMMNDFVQSHRTKQQDRILVDLADYRLHLIEEKSQENAQRQEELLTWMKDNQQRKDLYTEHFERLSKLFEPKT